MRTFAIIQLYWISISVALLCCIIFCALVLGAADLAIQKEQEDNRMRYGAFREGGELDIVRNVDLEKA